MPPTESLATTLVNDIAAIPAPFVLVLDDYQLIHNTLIHDALERLHGEPAVMTADYCESHELPPTGHAALDLKEGTYFLYEGKDQVDALNTCGVRAAFYNSSLKSAEARQVLDRALKHPPPFQTA